MRATSAGRCSKREYRFGGNGTFFLCCRPQYHSEVSERTQEGFLMLLVLIRTDPLPLIIPKAEWNFSH